MGLTMLQSKGQVLVTVAHFYQAGELSLCVCVMGGGGVGVAVSLPCVVLMLSPHLLHNRALFSITEKQYSEVCILETVSLLKCQQ